MQDIKLYLNMWNGSRSGPDWRRSRASVLQRPGRLRGSAEFEARAGIVVFNCQFEAMQMRDRLGNAETEPMPRRRVAMLAAIKATKYLRALLRRNAATGVADEHKRTSVDRASLDADRAARWGELDRIVDQVRDRLAHEVF